MNSNARRRHSSTLAELGTLLDMKLRSSFGAADSAASVLQAPGFRSDVTLFRLNATAVANLACSVRFCGIRRHELAHSRRLITRRSQVQILPPLLTEGPGNRAFSLRAQDAVATSSSALQSPSGRSTIFDLNGRVVNRPRLDGRRGRRACPRLARLNAN